MRPVDILLELKSRNIILKAQEGRLVLKNALGQLPEDLLLAIREQKATLLELCLAAQTQSNGLRQQSQEDHHPLSPMQRNIWVDQMLHPDVPNYNIGAAWELKGPLDVDVLKKALQVVTARHEILRTSFAIHDGEPRQQVSQHMELPWTELEPAEGSVTEIPQALYELIFPLDEAPLFRFFYQPAAGDLQYLYLVIHHLISDGWSLKLFFEEALQHYLGTDIEMETEKPFQFKDYARNHAGETGSEVHRKSRAFWLEKLKGQSFIMTGDRGLYQQQTFSGKNQKFKIDPILHPQIDELCHQESCTRYVLLLTLVKLSLYQFTGQRNMVIETPVMDRTHGNYADQMGPYLDSIPVCSHIGEEAIFRDYLAKVKAAFHKALSHKSYPIYLVRSELKKEDNQASELTNVNFTFHNKGLLKAQQLQFGDIIIRKLDFTPKTVTNGLSIYLFEYEEELTLSIDYSDELFSDSFITDLGSKFGKLLLDVLEDHTKTIHQLTRPEKVDQSLDLSFNF